MTTVCVLITFTGYRHAAKTMAAAKELDGNFCAAEKNNGRVKNGRGTFLPLRRTMVAALFCRREKTMAGDVCLAVCCSGHGAA